MQDVTLIMTTESYFRKLPITSSSTVRIEFNGAPLDVPNGVSIAAALLASGVTRFRATPVSGSPRAPYCMMGVCFECLVEVDGFPSKQACLIPVRAGMKIRQQEGAYDVNIIGGEQS